MKKLALILFVTCFALASVPSNVSIVGFEVVSENLVTVTDTPLVLTIDRTVDYVEIIPQEVNVDDLWFDHNDSVADVICYKPVGTKFTGFSNGRKLNYRGEYGINGLVLKKDVGSTTVGVVWYIRTRRIDQ